MSSWASLHNHTHYSLLDGISKPKDIAKRCVELGYNSVAMTDHGNLGCSIKFLSAMSGVCACGHQKDGEHSKGGGCRVCDCSGYSKYPLKPILGCEFYICQDEPTIKTRDNRHLNHLPVLARNLEGWRNLVALSSFTNRKENHYYHPRTNLKSIAQFAGNLIAFSGHPGSDLANLIFTNPKAAYAAPTRDDVLTHVNKDWPNLLKRKAGEYLDVFGKENFFLEVQILDPRRMPACLLIAEALRWLSKKTGIRRVATADSHYPEKWMAGDQRVVLAAALKTTLSTITKRAEQEEDVVLGGFFKGENYYIPSLEEMQVYHHEDEIVNALEIAAMCEEYDIRRQPMLPRFPCPGDAEPDEYLTHLCREGWRRRISSSIDKSDVPTYKERVERELSVIKGAGLSSYFLIVQDYCNWARSQGMLTGPGRGSGAGCLVSYLVGITHLDPIEHDLLFERFYNAGRNSPGHISLPDIDCDFPIRGRKKIIAYLKQKYGSDKVSQISTFNAMKGRGALTDVLRAHDVPFDVVKRITENIPEEARISEELQEMKDGGEDPSIIKYALQSDPEAFSDWCEVNDDGTFGGVYGPYFGQAIRLEGTKRNIGTHAAGVVLASEPLESLCPLIYNSTSDSYDAGMEYPDLEAQGQVKLDILGVAALDKEEGVRSLLRYGTVENPIMV